MQETEYSFLRDPDTGYTTQDLVVVHMRLLKAIVSYMREVTDYNWIGIRTLQQRRGMHRFASFMLPMDGNEVIDEP